MKLAPRLTAKSLKDAMPGELIKGRWGPATVLGIVTVVQDEADARLLLALSGPVPYWRRINTDGRLVLSFGHDYQFRPQGDAIISPASTVEFEALGAMLISEEATVLRVAPPDFNFAKIYYDLSTGLSLIHGEKPQSQMALLGWRVYLNSAPKDDPPLYEFSMPKPER